MNKKQSIIIAMAGAVLLAASQAQAQINYNNEDLLLNFRNTANTAAANVTVDLGQVSAFSALTGRTVLDGGAGAVFTEAELLSALDGSLDNIGFTVVAVDTNSDTTWVTRAQPTITSIPQYAAQQPGLPNAINVVDQVGAIGRGVGGFDGTVVTAFGADGVIVGSGAAYSYQSLAAPAEQPSVINFLGENTARAAGGLLESVTTNNTVYSALWRVPVSGGGSDTYLGYFTFNGATGELDYTADVPIPLLGVSRFGASVVVSWPNTGSFVLQQNTAASATGWATSGYSVSTSNGTNSITILSPAGNLYFRLAN